MEVDCGFWAAKCLENGDMNGYDYWMHKYFETLKNDIENGNKIVKEHE